MTELSILIPARNEIFLQCTVSDILKNIRADTEIIVVLDGWECALEEHERLKVVPHSESIGQRAATNEAAHLAQGKYFMKLDAHCAFDEGFDTKMLREMRNDWTMVPIMRNLHAFDWVCSNGHRRYQGPSGKCKECGELEEKDIKWVGKTNPQSTAYCFDTEPHFQYFRRFKRRPVGRGPITETMSLQGSCFMVHRDKYFELNLCDAEYFGSWGSQGIEVACKTWLSGGSVMCNKNTWYAHMFRTQGADFGFPYKQSGRKIAQAKAKARELFFNDAWSQQIRPLSWLIKRFEPIPGWHYAEKDIKWDRDITEKVMKSGEKFNQGRGIDVAPKPSVGFVYYSDGHVPPNILKVCQKQIQRCANGNEIVSVTLVPMGFGRNIVMEAERGYLTMFQQILTGIEQSTADIIFLVEHDVLYAPAHFEFIPPHKDMFYYDENKWMLDYKTGHALFYNHMSTSMLVAYREVLLDHYRKRVDKVKKEGFTRRFGFEPGSHRPPRGCDNYGREPYMAKFPSIDLRHDMNLTPNRWRKNQFRNQRQLWAWEERDEVPAWGKTKGRMKEFLNAISKD